MHIEPWHNSCNASAPFFQIMSDTAKNPKVLEACHAASRLEQLQMLVAGLEKCQKSLNDYLDSKRNAFPRFFFISDDELLSILGSHDPQCVQEHMIKVITAVLGAIYTVRLCRMQQVYDRPTTRLLCTSKILS